MPVRISVVWGAVALTIFITRIGFPAQKQGVIVIRGRGGCLSQVVQVLLPPHLPSIGAFYAVNITKTLKNV